MTKCARLKGKLLKDWPYSSAITDFSRGSFYALFDTTSLWVIKEWVSPASPHRLEGASLLANLVVAVVCANHRSTLERFPGSAGFALGTTTYDFLQRWKAAEVPAGPPGGLSGITRHALMATLKELGVVRPEQGSYDFLLARALYCEHVCRVAPQAWKDIEERPRETLEILDQYFHLPVLARAHVGRYLELVDVKFFSAAHDLSLGPNALNMLSDLFPAELKPCATDGPLWRGYFSRVLQKVRGDLRPFAVELLGEEAAEYLLSWTHRYIGLYDASLLEHLLCECRKVLSSENRAHKRRKTTTEDEIYQALWRAAWDWIANARPE